MDGRVRRSMHDLVSEAFVTTETPVQLTEPAGGAETLTLFLPLAPNPVMGGHLVHILAEKVMDVDMTVEEGSRATGTDGVARRERPADVDGIDDDIVAERVHGVDSDDADVTPAAVGNGDSRNVDTASDAADSVDDASEAGERR